MSSMTRPRGSIFPGKTVLVILWFCLLPAYGSNMQHNEPVAGQKAAYAGKKEFPEIELLLSRLNPDHDGLSGVEITEKGKTGNIGYCFVHTIKMIK